MNEVLPAPPFLFLKRKSRALFLSRTAFLDRTVMPAVSYRSSMAPASPVSAKVSSIMRVMSVVWIIRVRVRWIRIRIRIIRIVTVIRIEVTANITVASGFFIDMDHTDSPFFVIG